MFAVSISCISVATNTRFRFVIFVAIEVCERMRCYDLFTLEVVTFVQVPPLVLFSGASALFGGKSWITISVSRKGKLAL